MSSNPTRSTRSHTEIVPSVSDPENLLGGEVVRAHGHTLSFIMEPLDECITAATGQEDSRRITAILEDESQVHSGHGEEPPNEETTSW